MKICKLCQKIFEDDLAREENPAEAIGTLFLENGTEVEASEICPECKEDTGILIVKVNLFPDSQLLSGADV